MREKTVVEDIKEAEPSQGKKKGKNKGEGKEKEVITTERPTSVVQSADPGEGQSDMVTKKAASSKPPVSIITNPPGDSTIAAPPSPVPSHHSHRPEIVVNVNVAPPPPAVVESAPGPPGPPASSAPPPPTASIHPSAVPLPPSVTSSPAPPVTMPLPRLMNPFKTKTTIEPVEEEEQSEAVDEAVTKTITTTTTTTTTGPLVPLETGLGYVENDPDWKPMPKPSTPPPPAIKIPEVSPGRVVETTTVETITYPAGTGPTPGGAGTKAGIKPIPMGESVSLPL